MFLKWKYSSVAYLHSTQHNNGAVLAGVMAGDTSGGQRLTFE